METKIKCPRCGHNFDVEEALSGKLQEHYQAEFEKKFAAHVEKFNEEKRELDAEKQKLQEQQAKHDEIIKTELSLILEKKTGEIEKTVSETFEEKIKTLEEENEKRKTENKTLREKEIALLKQQTELKEKEEELNLLVQKQLLEGEKEIAEKARAKERESFELERIRFMKQIEESRKLAEEMKRKAEQGSIQLQGEVQELALEDLLSKIYPFDKIQEVPKGVRGADSIQTVINERQQECGSIVYESKRTKNFSNDWIDKLKQDQVSCKADITVLVTETFPQGMDRFGERDGIWICGFHEVQSLSFVLRQMLIKTHSVKLTQENKGDKMELLYSYLTSNEFVQNIKRIVENYDAMTQQLNSEKKAMHKIWAAREKQIWVVQENLAALFGSIKGIAGKELETSSILELPDRKSE